MTYTKEFLKTREGSLFARLPISQRANFDKVKKAVEQRDSLTLDELIKLSGVNRESFLALLPFVQERVDLNDIDVFGEVEEPSEIAEANERSEALLKVLDTLTFEQREIVKLRYGFYDGYEFKLEEVGRIFKITRERVRQIKEKALRKLRQNSNNTVLMTYR